MNIDAWAQSGGAEQTPTVNKRIPVPKVARKRRGKLTAPPAVRNAAADYKAAYKRMYGVPIRAVWDGTWIRLAGQTEGVTAKRLREMTTQLKRRLGE